MYINHLVPLFPNEITDKIKSFIPRDRDMKSPISALIKQSNQVVSDDSDDSDDEAYSTRNSFKRIQRSILKHMHKNDYVGIVINYLMTLPYETIIYIHNAYIYDNWYSCDEEYIRHKNRILLNYDSVLDKCNQHDIYIDLIVIFFKKKYNKMCKYISIEDKQSFIKQRFYNNPSYDSDSDSDSDNE